MPAAGRIEHLGGAQDVVDRFRDEALIVGGMGGLELRRPVDRRGLGLAQ